MKALSLILLILGTSQSVKQVPDDKDLFKLTKESLAGILVTGKDFNTCLKVLESNHIEASSQFEQYQSISEKTIRYIMFNKKCSTKAKALIGKLKLNGKIKKYQFVSYEVIEERFFQPWTALDSLKFRQETELFRMRLQRRNDDVFFLRF